MPGPQDQFLRLLKKSVRAMVKPGSEDAFQFCVAAPTKDEETLLLLAPAAQLAAKRKLFRAASTGRDIASGAVVVSHADGVLITLALQKVPGVKATVFSPSLVKRWLKPIATGPLSFLKKVRIVRGGVKATGGDDAPEAVEEESVDGEAIDLAEIEDALAALDALLPEIEDTLQADLAAAVSRRRATSMDRLAGMTGRELLDTSDDDLALSEERARFYAEETGDDDLTALADRIAKIRTMKARMKEVRWQHVRVDLTTDELIDSFDLLDSAVLIRPAVEEPEDRVMITVDFRQFVRPEQPFRLDKSAVRRRDAPTTPLKEELEALYEGYEGLPPARTRAKIKAEWRDVGTHGGLPGVDATANVFGDTGALLIDGDSLDVPHVGMADRDYSTTLAFFGAKVVKTDAPLLLGGDVNLVGATFEFGEGYADRFAKHARGGGGLFVETHPFSHIFMPADKACDSKVMLGRIVEDGDIVFSSFHIPFGYAMVIRPNCIHGDGLTKGNLTVYLGSTPADTVACRTRDNAAPLQDINMVEPDPVDG